MKNNKCYHFVLYLVRGTKPMCINIRIKLRRTNLKSALILLYDNYDNTEILIKLYCLPIYKLLL